MNASPDPKEIIGLLSKLKVETPDYPADLFNARKAAFLKYIATIKIQIKGQGGEGGQQPGSGGSGSGLGGSTSAQGIAFQALIGLGLVAAMLVGSLLGDQVARSLHENAILDSGESSEQTFLPAVNGIATPTSAPPPTISLIPVITPELEITATEAAPVVDDVINSITINDETSKGIKSNPGLHLGQAPGTPAAPGQGNPGNINKPDKPEKDKPERPNRPNR